MSIKHLYKKFNMEIANLIPNKIGLSNNQLKILAIITMFIDHFGLQLFPQILIFRIIGRIALPIFAYMIAEGCFYTKNRLKYLLQLLILGLGCQIVFFFVSGSLYQGILLTFCLSIISIYAIDYFIKKKNIISFILSFLTISAVIFISAILPIIIKKSGFEFDYGVIGVFLPVAIYYFKDKIIKLLVLSLFICLLSLQFGNIMLYSFIAIPFLLLYNGKRGKYNLKYLFYLFYPLHLVVIFLLDFVI